MILPSPPLSGTENLVIVGEPSGALPVTVINWSVPSSTATRSDAVGAAGPVDFSVFIFQVPANLSAANAGVTSASIAMAHRILRILYYLVPRSILSTSSRDNEERY